MQQAPSLATQRLPVIDLALEKSHLERHGMSLAPRRGDAVPYRNLKTGMRLPVLHARKQPVTPGYHLISSRPHYVFTTSPAMINR
jgi:hypothetical protein